MIALQTISFNRNYGIYMPSYLPSTHGILSSTCLTDLFPCRKQFRPERSYSKSTRWQEVLRFSYCNIFFFQYSIEIRYGVYNVPTNKMMALQTRSFYRNYGIYKTSYLPSTHGILSSTWLTDLFPCRKQSRPERSFSESTRWQEVLRFSYCDVLLLSIFYRN